MLLALVCVVILFGSEALQKDIVPASLSSEIPITEAATSPLPSPLVYDDDQKEVEVVKATNEEAIDEGQHVNASATVEANDGEANYSVSPVADITINGQETDASEGTLPATNGISVKAKAVSTNGQAQQQVEINTY